EDGERVPFRVTDTGLGGACEVEGLDYDATDAALLAACKTTRPDRDVLVVHRLPLDPTRGALEPIEVPRSRLESVGLDPDFAPSAILVDSWGTLVLASARSEALLEIDREGHVLSGRPLARARHPQVEGLALTKDLALVLSDEKNGRDARITVYSSRAGEGRAP
ncbi:MAG: hypothetical protein KDA28_09255, partial [Phycisphaerales bacterium]|nr:hypothetical protein [Phycisphaerales bacterium]